MKTAMIATVAGLAGIASASPFFSANGVQYSNPIAYSTRGGTSTITIDLAGYNTWDAAGSALNETINVNLGGDYQVVGIGWDNVMIQTVGASWLSEARIQFNDSPVGLGLAVGAGDSFAGTGGPYSSGGILDLASIDPTFPFSAGADGVLQIEFHETFDDVTGAIDATFLSGTLTIQYVPTPGALAVLGMGGLVAGRRRR